MAYDLLIKGGRIVDGSGQPAYLGDVAVQDDRIAAIGRIREAARRTIDADGQLGRAYPRPQDTILVLPSFRGRRPQLTLPGVPGNLPKPIRRELGLRAVHQKPHSLIEPFLVHPRLFRRLRGVRAVCRLEAAGLDTKRVLEHHALQRRFPAPFR